MAPDEEDDVGATTDQKPADGSRSHPVVAQQTSSSTQSGGAAATADGNPAIPDRKRQDGGHTRPATSAPGEETAPPPPRPRVITGPAVPSYDEATGAVRPTVDSPPFNFPAATTTHHLPPSYEATPPGPFKQEKPIAIPQIIAPGPAAAAAASPFISAYPPSLLARGITEQAWLSFLDTVSALLTAKASDRAVAHAADVARSLGSPPANYGRGLASHARTAGRQIARDAKRLNLLAVAAGVVGAAASIPVHAALGAVHTVLAMPSTALAAVSRSPRTPLQRAATYSAVASQEWLNPRGLHAVLLDTRQLADMVRVSADTLLDVAAEGGRSGGGGAAGTMGALEAHLEKLSVIEEKTVLLSAQSLWLVLVPVVAEIDGSK